jgi:hypothetical protein
MSPANSEMFKEIQYQDNVTVDKLASPKYQTSGA